MHKFNNNSPIYLQICEFLKSEILLGNLNAGDKVEPVREYALNLGVNPNTMQRAFSILESEGIMFSERTTGRFITNDSDRIETLRKEKKELIIKNFFDEMSKIGIDNKLALDMMKKYVEGE